MHVSGAGLLRGPTAGPARVRIVDVVEADDFHASVLVRGSRASVIRLNRRLAGSPRRNCVLAWAMDTAMTLAHTGQTGYVERTVTPTT